MQLWAAVVAAAAAEALERSSLPPPLQPVKQHEKSMKDMGAITFSSS
jgi:hypothetical protein